MAHDFAVKEMAPFALEWDAQKHFPLDVIRRTATLGMGGIYVREDVGGSGLSRLDAALIFEGLSTGCPSTAAYISIHNMVAWMLDTYGTDVQRKAWVPRLCSMETLGGYALTEPGVGSDAAALSTKAIREGDEYVLTGVKQFISGGGTEKNVYIVMARTGVPGARGISAFILSRAQMETSVPPWVTPSIRPHDCPRVASTERPLIRKAPRSRIAVVTHSSGRKARAAPTADASLPMHRRTFPKARPFRDSFTISESTPRVRASQ